MNRYDEANSILEGRFGRDSHIALATVEDGRPYVRTVDGYYEEGAFYIVTNALSTKMRQMKAHPEVAVCGEWFTGHGIGENLGHVLAESNGVRMAKLRGVFAEWYTGGHVNEDDPNTCLLRIRLTEGILMKEGTRYAVDFVKRIASC